MRGPKDGRLNVTSGINGLRGKVAVVTGAASGIGQATAKRFAEEGTIVHAVDIDDRGLTVTLEQIERTGTAGSAVNCDVRDEQACATAVARAIQRWGRIDILVNAAGILRFAEPGGETKAIWDEVLAVNLTGVFLMSTAALPAIVETQGCIVNVASTAAQRGQPWSLAYSASKGGVDALTRAFATDYGAAGVRINSVVPGGTVTPLVAEYAAATKSMDPSVVARMQNLLGRAAAPGEIAGVIAFLASDDARYITGAAVVADGGLLT